mmetsp:Transcript_7682/g.14462  ORF Transcript_7682/g.14462 Transcript_7682/m.14462 type:complete len:254 (-) Transcript_7682:63-824(-)
MLRKVISLLVFVLYLVPSACFSPHHKLLVKFRPPTSWRVSDSSESVKHQLQQQHETPLTHRPFHLLHTDACCSIGGGYYLDGHSFSQFRWTRKEKIKYGARRLKPLNRTDIRILEFATAVMAVYTERRRLQGSCVTLCIDNCGAWKWLNTRKMNHLWGRGWMRLLQTVCEDYDIVIKPVSIIGADNPVADALSRYKTYEINGVDLSKLKGRTCMTSPGPRWRDRMWNNDFDDSELCGGTARVLDMDTTRLIAG